MSASETDNLGTTEVREGYAIDFTRLTRWMQANLEGFAGPLSARQFKGGQSNPTYELITPDRHYVLRRKPPGQLLRGAHAIDREAMVLGALERARFPVAHVFGLCTDEQVIGSWFYIMEMVEGRIFWNAALPDFSQADRVAIFDAMNQTIAQLHSVDYRSIGLEDFGKAGNYFERQIARWSGQYFADTDAGRNPDMDRVIIWLKDNIPESDETALIHGDYRIDNMIFHPTELRVVAVLDWELSTLGHPLADFSYHAMMYRLPPHIVAGLSGIDTAALGIPSEQEYIGNYCRRTGRASLESYDFYVAFNFFRLAAIFHGIKGRAARGTAASSNAQTRAAQFPELAALALAQTR